MKKEDYFGAFRGKINSDSQYIRLTKGGLFKKFQNSRNHAPFAARGFAQTAAKPRAAMCILRKTISARLRKPVGISCADIARQIGFFHRLGQEIPAFDGLAVPFFPPEV